MSFFAASGFPDFPLTADAPASAQARSLGLHRFSQAAAQVKSLPYRRNADRGNLISVLREGCGTCSSKHGILKVLAEENGYPEIRLMTGIFKMDAEYAPVIGEVLAEVGLDYIPEAHNYLRYGAQQVLDCTTAASGPEGFLSRLMEEKEINAGQTGAWKASYHRQFLSRWLREYPAIRLSETGLWELRERCIAALSGANRRES